MSKEFTGKRRITEAELQEMHNSNNKKRESMIEQAKAEIQKLQENITINQNGRDFLNQSLQTELATDRKRIARQTTAILKLAKGLFETDQVRKSSDETRNLYAAIHSLKSFKESTLDKGAPLSHDDYMTVSRLINRIGAQAQSYVGYKANTHLKGSAGNKRLASARMIAEYAEKNIPDTNVCEKVQYVQLRSRDRRIAELQAELKAKISKLQKLQMSTSNQKQAAPEKTGKLLDTGKLSRSTTFVQPNRMKKPCMAI